MSLLEELGITTDMIQRHTIAPPEPPPKPTRMKHGTRTADDNRKYHQQYKARLRARFVAQGLTTEGKPRKQPHINRTPEFIHAQSQAQTDRRRMRFIAQGLTTAGKVRRRLRINKYTACA
jgi:hypothetical protein